MLNFPRVPKFDLIALPSVLIGAGLSIIAGKPVGWLMVGIGIGILIVVHAPASWSGRIEKGTIVLQAPPALPPISKVRPRIRLFGTRMAYLYVPYDSSYFAETSNKEIKALLAIFENEVHSIQGAGYVGNVKAKIRYKDENGKEISELRVQEGCWLQASSHEVGFPANTQHELIIATKDYHNAKIIREGYRKYAELKNTTYMQQKLYVETSLISGGEILLTSHYILVSTDKEFSLTPAEE
jgi:hypothetical protein